eukprot:gene7374-512_t
MGKKETEGFRIKKTFAFPPKVIGNRPEQQRHLYNGTIQDIQICTISDDLIASLKKFRFRKAKNNAAIIMKIDQKTREVIIEDEMEDVSLEDVAEELPEFSPRYIAFRRNSFLRLRVNTAIATTMPMVDLASRSCLFTIAREVFEVRSVDDMTTEWMKKRLNFFD